MPKSANTPTPKSSARTPRSGSFTSFLVRSLELLKVEAPAGYDLVCRRLGARCVAIEVDGEQLSVTNTDGVLDVKWGAHRAVATASASKATLKALLCGEQELTEALLQDQILLVGATSDLVAFYEGLLAYFMSAVRSPGFAPLLDEFFGPWAAPRAAETTRGG